MAFFLAECVPLREGARDHDSQQGISDCVKMVVKIAPDFRISVPIEEEGFC